MNVDLVLDFLSAFGLIFTAEQTEEFIQQVIEDQRQRVELAKSGDQRLFEVVRAEVYENVSLGSKRERGHVMSTVVSNSFLSWLMRQNHPALVALTHSLSLKIGWQTATLYEAIVGFLDQEIDRSMAAFFIHQTVVEFTYANFVLLAQFEGKSVAALGVKPLWRDTGAHIYEILRQENVFLRANVTFCWSDQIEPKRLWLMINWERVAFAEGSSKAETWEAMWGVVGEYFGIDLFTSASRNYPVNKLHRLDKASK